MKKQPRCPCHYPKANKGATNVTQEQWEESFPARGYLSQPNPEDHNSDQPEHIAERAFLQRTCSLVPTSRAIQAAPAARPKMDPAEVMIPSIETGSGKGPARSALVVYSTGKT